MSPLDRHFAVRAHVSRPWPPDLADRLRPVAPGVHVTAGEPVEDPDAIEVLVAGRPDADLLDRMSGLRGVLVPFAGLPARTRTLLQARPHLAVWNIHHNAGAVAEHVVALLLAVTRRIVPSHVALQRGDWTPRYDGPRSTAVRGRHAVVVGFGHIGQAVAPLLRGLGMRVSGVRSRTGDPVDGVPVVGVDTLGDLLPTADVVVLCLPSTDATRGLFDGPRLARLPAGAVLVNVGRADAVDPDALADALHTGTLAGAALDVWWTYPTGDDDRMTTTPCPPRLAAAPNLVMSPHRSGHDDRAEDERVAALAAALHAIRAGDDARWRVDLERGY